MVPHQVMMAIIKMTRYTRIEMDSNKYVNTTSNFKYNWPVKKLDTENSTNTLNDFESLYKGNIEW